MSSLSSPDALNILIIDDDDVDIMALKRAFRHVNQNHRIHCCRDGQEALDYLTSMTHIQKPTVVLLDLNMPRLGGLEFLSVIRRHPTWNSLYIFVLTTSDNPDDVLKAYEYNVAGYFKKPLDPRVFSQQIQLLDEFLKTAILP
ncbi:MAG: response regulator [Cyanobacteria bacterium]|nr:response regulator [Cyanobacteriota bacterium]